MWEEADARHAEWRRGPQEGTHVSGAAGGTYYGDTLQGPTTGTHCEEDPLKGPTLRTHFPHTASSLTVSSAHTISSS